MFHNNYGILLLLFFFNGLIAILSFSFSYLTNLNLRLFKKNINCAIISQASKTFLIAFLIINFIVSFL